MHIGQPLGLFMRSSLNAPHGWRPSEYGSLTSDLAGQRIEIFWEVLPAPTRMWYLRTLRLGCYGRLKIRRIGRDAQWRGRTERKGADSIIARKPSALTPIPRHVSKQRCIVWSLGLARREGVGAERGPKCGAAVTHDRLSFIPCGKASRRRWFRRKHGSDPWPGSEKSSVRWPLATIGLRR
jgi:hypothetical protein